MPRTSSGPRLWFDKRRGTWTIVDGRNRSRTGFRKNETSGAEKALEAHIGSKHVVKKSNDPLLSDVLDAYSDEHLEHAVAKSHISYDIDRLIEWWGTKRVSEINAKTCRDYANHRNAQTSARRELAFLNAAIKHWHKEHGPLSALPTLIYPPKPAARIHYLTRPEAARFLREARREPHLARFFIIGWYTGSRRTVIGQLRWSQADLKTGLLKRKPDGAVQTKKRAPPVLMGSRLLAHMRRWRRLDGDNAEFIVHFRGKPITRPVRSWQRARIAAKLPKYVTPHILRHSRATYMMKQGIDPWMASNALGMSLAMLTNVYGHHSPDWQRAAAEVK